MTAEIMLRNNVKVLGQGTQPVLFAHGFGCDQNMWRQIVPAFLSDYRVILFDYVGAGKSDWSAYTPERYGSLDGYARDVLDICEALNLTDVIFVGHSVSGMIGLLAALQSPGATQGWYQLRLHVDADHLHQAKGVARGGEAGAERVVE